MIVLNLIVLSTALLWALSYAVRGGFIQRLKPSIVLHNWPERLQWSLIVAVSLAGVFWYTYGTLPWVVIAMALGSGIGAFLGNVGPWASHGHYFTMNTTPRALRLNQNDWLGAFLLTYPKVFYVKETYKGSHFELKKGFHVAWIYRRVPLVALIKNEYWRDFAGMATIGTIRGAFIGLPFGLLWLPLAAAIAHPVAYSLRGAGKNTQTGEWVFGTSLGLVASASIIYLTNYYI